MGSLTRAAEKHHEAIPAGLAGEKTPGTMLRKSAASLHCFLPKANLGVFLSEQHAASVYSDPQEKPSLSAGPLRPCWCLSGQHGAGSPRGLPGLLLGLPSWRRHHPSQGGSASQGGRGVRRRHRGEKEKGGGSVVLSTAKRELLLQTRGSVSQPDTHRWSGGPATVLGAVPE